MSDAEGLTVEFKVDFKAGRKGRKRVSVRSEKPAVLIGQCRLPRITRLMALAIRLEQLIREGEVEDYAEIARLGHVTRARVSQIMNLLHLAPDIQDAILHLPAPERGRDGVREHQLRPIVALLDWQKQRVAWRGLEA